MDKWLWAARFFKTRSLAVEAINGGKVHLNGQRTKPGRIVRPGMRVRIQKDRLHWDLLVTGLTKQRRPASEAALLYEEDEESRRQRQALVRERRQHPSGPRTGKPNKRDRRRIQRLMGRDR